MSTFLELPATESKTGYDSESRTALARGARGTMPGKTKWLISNPRHNSGITVETPGLLEIQEIYERALVPEVVLAPTEPVSQTSSRLLGLWEGYITEIAGEVFFARLIDLHGTDVDHEAEFEMESVSDFDKDLVQEGAVFYWSIFYNQSLAGQRSTSSDLRFRRRPVWTEEDIVSSEGKISQFAKLLGI